MVLVTRVLWSHKKYGKDINFLMLPNMCLSVYRSFSIKLINDNPLI